MSKNNHPNHQNSIRKSINKYFDKTMWKIDIQGTTWTSNGAYRGSPGISNGEQIDIRGLWSSPKARSRCILDHQLELFRVLGPPRHRFWEPGGASASILEAPVYQFRDISHHTQRGLMQTSHTQSRAELGGKQIRRSTNWWCLNCTWKIRQIIPTLFTAFFLSLVGIAWILFRWFRSPLVFQKWFFCR